MTKARDIIQDSLTFGLNRLSPGESADADVLATCLRALNNLADSLNGQKSFLFREILTTSGAITGAIATLGTDWAGLSPGDEILGATVSYGVGMDTPLNAVTMQEYQSIPIKATGSLPQVYAHDGLATVYLYPAATGQSVTLRTRQVVSDFADLDTDYSMPKGYRAALSALLNELLAPVLLGGITNEISSQARRARSQLANQGTKPGIINGQPSTGNILTGWH